MRYPLETRLRAQFGTSLNSMPKSGTGEIVPVGKVDYSVKPARTEAKIANFNVATDSADKNGGRQQAQGTVIFREAEHVHPVGSGYDLVMFDPSPTVDNLILCAAQMQYGQDPAINTIHFTRQEMLVLKRNGIDCLPYTTDIFLLASPKKSIQEKLCAKCLPPAIEEKLRKAVLESQAFMQMPQAIQKVVLYCAAEYLKYVQKNQLAKVYDSQRARTIRHEYEHVQQHFAFGRSNVIEVFNESMALIDALIQNNPRMIFAFGTILAAKTMLEANFKTQSKLFKVYEEAVCILTELKIIRGRDICVIDEAGVLTRSAMIVRNLFLTPPEDWLDLAKNDKHDNRYILAFFSILLNNDLVLNNNLTYITSETLANKWMRLLQDPRKVLSIKTLEKQYEYFQLRRAQMLLQLDNWLEYWMLLLNAHGLEYKEHALYFQGKKAAVLSSVK